MDREKKLSDWASLRQKSLLPINTSNLELALSETLSQALDFEVEQSIVGIKQNPPDTWLDTLIYEYGLNDLSPYFSNKRLLIQEGVLFNRIRGTPKSLKIALSWRDIEVDILESAPSRELLNDLKAQNYQPFHHFAEFDLERREAIFSEKPIVEMMKLVDLARPLRSRWWRLVHQLNQPVFSMDTQALSSDALLSDDSGYHHVFSGGERLKISQKIKRQSALNLLEDVGEGEAYQSALITVKNISHARDAIAWLLDDKADDFECFSAIIQDSGKIKGVRYVGQCWTASRWEEESWQSALTLVLGAQSQMID